MCNRCWPTNPFESLLNLDLDSSVISTTCTKITKQWNRVTKQVDSINLNTQEDSSLRSLKACLAIPKGLHEDYFGVVFSAARVSSGVCSEGGVDGIMGGELESTRRARGLAEGQILKLSRQGVSTAVDLSHQISDDSILSILGRPEERPSS